MVWIVLGVAAFAGGVLMLRVGRPGGRAHATFIRGGLLEQAYAFGCLLLLALGAGLVAKGLADIAA